MNRRKLLAGGLSCICSKGARCNDGAFICSVIDNAPLHFEPADGTGKDLQFNTSQQALYFTPYGTAFQADAWKRQDSLDALSTKIILGVWFRDGNAFQKDAVKTGARKWLDTDIGSKIDFCFGASKREAHIRVTFAENGNWSEIGRRALTNSSPYTMTIDDVTHPAAIIHEFGHALGLQHEHRFPASTIEWNEPVVYAAMRQKGWTDSQTREQILTKLGPTAVCLGSPHFDQASIMMYPIGDDWATYLDETNRRRPLIILKATSISADDVACLKGLYPS